MTFRGDDDARDERTRALEKQLEDARRELEALRPKAGRFEAAEKENRRLTARLAQSGESGAAPWGRVVGAGLAATVLGIVAIAGLIVFSPPRPVRSDDDGRADLERRESELRAAIDALHTRDAELQRREEALRAATTDGIRPHGLPAPGPLSDELFEREVPTRTEIDDAMAAVQPVVDACDEGSYSTVVHVTFGSSGVPTSVVLEGSFDEPTTACILRAVQDARVPPFSAEAFVVTYTLRT